MELIEQAWLDYQQQLAAFIRSKVDNSQDAEDIVNDVFTKLLKQSAQATLPDNISAWLYQVARNNIVDYYRSKKQFESLPDDLVMDDGKSLSEELSDCLLPMIKTLPEEYQQVLILAEIEGKKHKEVAKILDLSLSAVKTRVLRGRAKLKQSVLRCCTVTYNKAGSFVDYEQKMADSSDNCSC
jgi:RNA polymerase sigma-70 factor, ECF subfamily